MKVVEVRSETKSLNSALDVLLDVRSRVGDTAGAKNVKSTLGSDWKRKVSYSQ